MSRIAGQGSWGALFIVFGCLCAVGGWAVIELTLWAFSFITISFG